MFCNSADKTKGTGAYCICACPHCCIQYRTCPVFRALSLFGNGQTEGGNKKLFAEFLDLEVPDSGKGGLVVTLFDRRRNAPVTYSFSSLIYAIRCMVHENENLNATEQPDYHVLLDWKMHPHDRSLGVLADGAITLNARAIWLRLREVVAKFVWGVEAAIALGDGRDFAMSRDLCSIKPDMD